MYTLFFSESGGESVSSKIFPLFPASKKQIPRRVHMEEPLAIYHLATHLRNFLKNTHKKKQPLILCIGTDRATGDSLGPLTGWQLKTLLTHQQATIIGTIDSPVHAGNLKTIYASLTSQLTTHPLIAIDACLGHFTNVGTLVFHNQPLKPGSALNKHLPPVGDVGITGVVNIGGLMERQIIQNTRLNTVLKMSRIIAYSILIALNTQSLP